MYYLGPVSEGQLVEALHQVPPERRQEALQYLTSLGSAAGEDAEGDPIHTAADLARSPLVGLWALRKDLNDSRSVARQLRQQAEHRAGTSHVTGQ
jgi:hypothetical protein